MNFQLTDVFHHIIWFGDCNYRLKPSIDCAEAIRLVDAFDIAALIKHDELAAEISAGTTFAGFNEPPITFLPTYKRKLNRPLFEQSALPPIAEDSAALPTDWVTAYYNTAHKQPWYKSTSFTKPTIVQRVPAYCDRVLYRSMPLCTGQLEWDGYDQTNAFRIGYRSVDDALITSDHSPIQCGFTLHVTPPPPPPTPPQSSPRPPSQQRVHANDVETVHDEDAAGDVDDGDDTSVLHTMLPPSRPQTLIDTSDESASTDIGGDGDLSPVYTERCDHILRVMYARLIRVHHNDMHTDVDLLTPDDGTELRSVRIMFPLPAETHCAAPTHSALVTFQQKINNAKAHNATSPILTAVTSATATLSAGKYLRNSPPTLTLDDDQRADDESESDDERLAEDEVRMPPSPYPHLPLTVHTTLTASCLPPYAALRGHRDPSAALRPPFLHAAVKVQTLDGLNGQCTIHMTRQQFDAATYINVCMPISKDGTPLLDKNRQCKLHIVLFVSARSING